MDWRIEHVRFHPRGFRDENPLVWEIRTSGIPLLRSQPNGKHIIERHRAARKRLAIPRIVKFWRESAAEDWKTARSRFERKSYLHALFFGYRYLEKMLKAIVVEHTRQHAPYARDLIDLAELAQLKLTPPRQALLRRAMSFDLDGLYPEQEIALRAQYTRKVTASELDEIRKTGRWFASLLG